MKCPFCHKDTAAEARLCVHCGKDSKRKLSNKRTGSVVCPACNVPASILNLAGVDLDFCHECGGIWFDKREMKQFQKAVSDAKTAEKITSLLNEMALGKTREPRGSYLACPICKDLMIQRNYLQVSGILLDQCLRHGTWADRQDLVNILELISNGDMEELMVEASNKRLGDLEKKVREVGLNQTFIKADIARINRIQRTHMALDILGIL